MEVTRTINATTYGSISAILRPGLTKPLSNPASYRFLYTFFFSLVSFIQRQSIDHRCEEGRFQVSASFVTISNPDSLSSCETGVDPGIRSWRKHSSDWARCQKAIGDIYFTKKGRAETLQPGLELDNFQRRLKSGIFKCISWLNSSFFLLGWWSRFSERGSQDLSNGIHVAS